MKEVLELASELNRKLLGSEEYMSYLRVKDRLLSYPTYKLMVDNFRKKQVELEARKLNGIYVDPGEEMALSNEYADICLISVCNDFFQGEMALLDMIKSAYAKVGENLNLDMDFLNGADV